jgi:hypothetical protein
MQGAGRRLCDGFTRRAFLGVRTSTGLALGLPDLQRERASGGRARSCIVLSPFGGPCRIDTFDPKPNAPEARGNRSGIGPIMPRQSAAAPSESRGASGGFEKPASRGRPIG